MNVLHFSVNSLAGMPLRLSRGLDKLGGVTSRLADKTRYSMGQLGWYEHDLVFDEEPDAVIEAARAADVIHLHNYLDLDSDDFAPLNFRQLQQAGKIVVRQFHSIPSVVAERMNVPLSRVRTCELPALVISHYPERFYPKARVVPNFVPQDEIAYLPSGQPASVDLFFSPTKMTSAWENRWNTKGAPEVMALFERLGRQAGCSFEVMHGKPLARVLERKAAARIVVDDLSNGSMHLSGLEGVSMGRCVLSFLDVRQLKVLAEMAGTDEHPFVNVKLEQAESVLGRLLADPDEADRLGLAARRWIERHYSERELVSHYLRAYDVLGRDPSALRRQRVLALDTPWQRFWAVTVPERRWQARARRGRKEAGTGRE